MDTYIKRLKVCMGRSDQNSSLSRKHIYVCWGLILTLYGVRRFLEELDSGSTQKTAAESFDVSRSVIAWLWSR